MRTGSGGEARFRSSSPDGYGRCPDFSAPFNINCSCYVLVFALIVHPLSVAFVNELFL